MSELMNTVWELGHSDAFHPGSRDDCSHCQFMIQTYGPMPPVPVIEFMSKRPGVGIEIIKRDGVGCRHCGAVEGLAYDHIVSRAKGGGDELANLQALCMPCNSRKGAR